MPNFCYFIDLQKKDKKKFVVLEKKFLSLLITF